MCRVRKVNIHEAKTTLSQLVEAAESCETIVLVRAGMPVAKLVGLERLRGVRLGLLKGRVPKQLLDDLARPLTRKQIDRLFGFEPEP